jgi:1,2-phenylacetyl-CoA epoxidase catalytic subunit
MAADPRVFISYSRKDGEDFATDLRQRLEREHPEIPLWQDRQEMIGGLDWWQQIEQALEVVEFMVLVATPQAMASSIVRKEWRYARQQGVCVFPVVVPDKPIDFNSLPRWMRDVHFYHLDHEWDTFINYLKSPCQMPRVPFMAPDLPEHYVNRPAHTDALIAHLLDAARDNPLAITTALQGAGGFGKTTLAADLCHNDDVQNAFDDGILWVTLGEDPNLVGALTKLYRALTNETPGFVDAEEGAAKLAEKLADWDVLLVIDDVWDAAHLTPFMRGGKRCARLITTRWFEIAETYAERIDVDEMTTGEAVQMLTAGLADLPDDRSAFAELARRLGEWPLLLELANGELRQAVAWGDSLAGALAALNEDFEEEGITVLDQQDARSRNKALALTMQASLRRLDEDQQARLFALAIFPEDTDIPLATIGQLWGVSRGATRRLCQHLANMSFFRLDRERNVIRFHDVLREYLGEQLGEVAPTTHARLLDAWGDDWAALPDDYAWNHYAYHLHGAGRDDELLALFADQQWMNARFAHDGYTYTGYIADLMLAWEDVADEQARAQLAAGQDMTALPDCVRLALIRTSINSLAGNHVPAIVARAITTGVWTTTRALSIAHNVPDAEKRAKMYIALLETDTLSEQERKRARQQTLAAAQAIQDEGDRARVLIALAEKLEGEQVTEALAAAQAIQDEGSRASALIALAEKLAGEQRHSIMTEALAAAQAIQDERDRARVLSALAEKLAGEQRHSIMTEALAAAQAIQDEGDRAWVLSALAEKLAGEQRHSIMTEALAAAQAIQYEGYRARVLICPGGEGGGGAATQHHDRSAGGSAGHPG